MAGIFSQVVLDPNRHQVDVYVTDPARAVPMIMAAAESHATVGSAGARGVVVQVRKAAYTSQELDAARSVYLSEHHPFEIYAIGSAPDGSGLAVEVANPQLAAKQSSGAHFRVKVTFNTGSAASSKSTTTPQSGLAPHNRRGNVSALHGQR